MKAKGFTLIELVVVIVVLAILAVTALPQFLNLQRDAKVADIQGMAGAVNSAAELAYSRSAIDGKENLPAHSIDVGLSSPALVQFGYPQVIRTGMEYFLQAESSYHNEDDTEWAWGAENPNNFSGPHYWVVTQSKWLGDGPYTRADIIASECYVRYNAPIAEGEQYSVETFTDGC